tara:strand:+ start:569 stop:958 length:390 start_codon:yes stop_codon:yes gene_type:complete
MATTVTTIYDKDWETLAWVQCSGAESAQTVLDASGLRGADTNPRLGITLLEWNAGAVDTSIAIIADASSDDTLMTVYGTGKMNHPNFKLLNPETAGCTGDILVTTSAAANFLIRAVKTSGYGSGIQAYN